MPMQKVKRVLAVQGWWALGSLWLAVNVWSFLNGPRLQAELAVEIARETERDNQRVCQQLHMPSGGASYAACASTLDGVRRQQDERTEQRLNGSF